MSPADRSNGGPQAAARQQAAAEQRKADLAALEFPFGDKKPEPAKTIEVAPGTADGSYGIHVARLAGLPEAALARAEEVLRSLESGEQAGAVARLADDLPLFAAQPARKATAQQETPAPSAAETRLGEINPDELTPRAALELLYELKALLGGKGD